MGLRAVGRVSKFFLFLLSGEGETRLEFVIKCQHHPKIHPIEKKNPPQKSARKFRVMPFYENSEKTKKSFPELLFDPKLEFLTKLNMQ